MKNVIRKIVWIAFGILIALSVVGCIQGTKEHEHTYGEWIITTQPTEETEGVKEKICTVCGFKIEETVAKLNHVHSKGTYHPEVAGTCVTKGTVKYYDCVKATCEIKLDETGNPLASIEGKLDPQNHTFGEWKSNYDATATSDGTKTRTCSSCSHKETVTDAGSKVPEGFVLIVPGTFMMGSHNEETGYPYHLNVHKVTLTKGFFMSDHEVTQKEYEKVMGSNPSYHQAPYIAYTSTENFPVEKVSWYMALVYCNKLSMAEGLTPCYTINGATNPAEWGEIPEEDSEIWNAVECNFNANGYRLPTEAEWEYSARAGNNNVDNPIWCGTDNVEELSEYANYGWFATMDVKQKKPNAFGLYDMTGNVREWCWDWFTEEYLTEDAIDPIISGTPTDRRTMRSNFYGWPDTAVVLYDRGDDYPYSYDDGIGFRVCRTVK